MSAFDGLIGAELLWLQPRRTKLQFELRAGERALATLEWRKKGRVLGKWGDEHYWFSGKGWLRPVVLIHRGSPQADETVALDGEPVVTYTQRDGTLAFADGREFFWKKPRFWTSEHDWKNADSSLVRFWPANWRARAAVTIEPPAADQPELPLLVLLGQYLNVRARQDAEAASSAGVVAVIASS